MKLSVPNSLFICKSIFCKYFPVCFRWPFLRNLFFKTRNLYFISLHVSSPVSRGCLSISEGSSWKSPVFEGKLVCKTIQSPQFKRNSPVFSWKQYFFSKKKGRHHVTCWHTLFFWLSFFEKDLFYEYSSVKGTFSSWKSPFWKRPTKFFLVSISWACLGSPCLENENLPFSKKYGNFFLFLSRTFFREREHHLSCSVPKTFFSFLKNFCFTESLQSTSLLRRSVRKSALWEPPGRKGGP